MENKKIQRLLKWNRVLRTFIQGDGDKAEELMDEMINDLKGSVDDEEIQERINTFMTDLEESYVERAKEIDEKTQDRKPEDMKKRRKGYFTLNQWRIGEMFRLLNSILYENNLIPEVEGEIEIK